MKCMFCEYDTLNFFVNFVHCSIVCHRTATVSNPKSSKATTKSKNRNKGKTMALSQQQKLGSRKTWWSAAFYVLSGCCQPLLVTLLKEAGLADSKCQIYMLFYYILPAISTLPLLLGDARQSSWPTRRSVFKASGYV